MLNRMQILLEDWQVEYLENIQGTHEVSFSETVRMSINNFILNKPKLKNKDQIEREDIAYKARKKSEYTKQRARWNRRQPMKRKITLT